jgi:hypothetical protein
MNRAVCMIRKSLRIVCFCALLSGVILCGLIGVVWCRSQILNETISWRHDEYWLVVRTRTYTMRAAFAWPCDWEPGWRVDLPVPGPTSVGLPGLTGPPQWKLGSVGFDARLKYGVIIGFEAPYWLLMLVTGAPPGLYLSVGHRRRRRTRTRARLGLCPNCGYDVRFNKERCPECGERI